MSDRFLSEEHTDTPQESYFGENAEQVEGRLLGYHDTIYGGGICEGGVEDMWKAVRRDPAALAYLAGIYAERMRMEPQIMQRRGIRLVRHAARKVLCDSGRLPVEVHENFARRKHGDSDAAGDYVAERDVLILEDM